MPAAHNVDTLITSLRCVVRLRGGGVRDKLRYTYRLAFISNHNVSRTNETPRLSIDAGRHIFLRRQQIHFIMYDFSV